MKPFAALAVAAGLALGHAGLAAAADYRVADDSDRGLGLVDADSIVAVGDARRLQFVAVLKDGDQDSFNVLVSRVLLDCAGARYRIEEVDVFDLEMNYLTRETGDPDQTRWSPALPDSPFTPTADFACRGKALPRPATQDLKTLANDYAERRRGQERVV
ncbi:MAG: surface-adhesin E family protein [Pseudomonadota bacterium]